MAPEKVTVMILDVDLKCSCCYKKVKKLLCKFPQIRDQVFDEDKNKVRITVVCCNPEKFRDKLCCNGGKAIQRIEIVEDKPEKPKEVEKLKPVETPKQLEKKPSGKGDKPKDNPPKQLLPVCCSECYEGRRGGPCEYGYRRPVLPPPVEKPKDTPPTQPHPVCCSECYEGRRGGPCEYGYGSPVLPPPVEKPKDTPPKQRQPVCCSECYEGRHGGPCEYWYGRPVLPPPVEKPKDTPPKQPQPVCCSECYEGRRGGPCEYWYGRPVPPPPGPCYDGYGYGGNRACYASRCDYFSEENQQGCSIM